MTYDEEGFISLACLVQTSISTDQKTSRVYCDVIDSLDVTPVIKQHEYLISNIVRISYDQEHPTDEWVIIKCNCFNIKNHHHRH